MTIHPRTPVLIGVGQTKQDWNGADAAAAPSPLSLCRDAARVALTDAGADVAGAVDVVAVVRTNLDSVPGAPQPFPQWSNPPRALAHALGIAPEQAVYSTVGGDQPQVLVNDYAEAIFRGDAEVALLAGSEAIATMKTAARRGVALDWSHPDHGAFDDRGTGKRLLSPYEIANGLGYPTQTYPAFEHALRARMGLDRAAYRRLISELWATFAAVAAANPHAQFPVARSADFLATESAENYAVADPYLKWHVAQDAVNQGAAVILTSVARAQALGVPEAKWVYLHGYAAGKDVYVTARPDLSRSRAMELVLARALASARKTAADIGVFDLYSCFPCAVLIAAEALGVDWRKTPMTVTGGLPFFGGPGNNYSMHAIATMTERLRAAPGALGLVLANGGFLSKEAAGVYSTTPAEDWAPVSSADIQAELDAQTAPALIAGEAEAVIETFTVTWKKGVPQRGFVLARSTEGRVLARAATGDRATLDALAKDDPVGRRVHVRAEGGVNIIAALV